MKALTDHEPYRELVESIGRLKADLTAVNAEIAGLNGKDSVTALAENLIAGGTLEDIGERQASAESLEKKRQVLAKALALQEAELVSGPVKGAARAMVRESLLPRQREIAADMEIAVENLLEALKQASGFQGQLQQRDIHVGEPLRDLLLTDNTRGNLENWLAENRDFAEEVSYETA